MNYLIDQAIAQRILDYLTKQPYAEVFQFIPVLVQLQPAPDVPPVPPEGDVPPKADPAS